MSSSKKLSNSLSDIVYVFAQVFKNDITYDAQFDEVIMSDSFDLFKYPISIREMFYKYYPMIYDRYTKTLKNYDLKKLEADIVKDSELLYIPMYLIDTSGILNKTFGKLLSQDYEFLQLKTQRERDHYKIKYVVKYTDELGGCNINKYLSLGYIKPIDVINLTGATMNMDIKYLSEFFNGLTKETFDDLQEKVHTEFYSRFSSDKELNEFNENAMQFVVSIFAEHGLYHEVIYSEKYKNTLFPALLAYVRADHPLSLKNVQTLTNYFIREIDMNKKLTNIRSIIASIIAKSKAECNKKLTNVELLKRIYRPNRIEDKDDDKDDDKDAVLDAVLDKVLDKFDITNPDVYEYIVKTASYEYMTKNIPEHSINNSELIKEREPRFYKFFDYYSNDDIMTYIMNANGPNDSYDDTSDEKDDKSKVKSYNRAKRSAKKYIIAHYFDSPVKNIPDKPNEAFVREFIKCNEYVMKELLKLCDAYGLLEQLESNELFIGYWFEQMILRKTINKKNFNEFWKDYGDRAKSRMTLGFAWIKTYHEEPPLEIYASPNVNIDGDTNASLWKRYVNECTIPKEMTSVAYYDYMIKTKGIKKNPNCTMMYTFFSNSLENKIIFCKSDIEFNYPAVERYSIPIEYDKIKPFLHEELETNDICMFASLDKDDWEKIAGGKSDVDVVCFSDCKNIYRERTPLKRVIEYIIMHIELTFGEECEEI